MTCSLCSVPLCDCVAPATHRYDSLARAAAREALACLVAELRRLSAHQHDATAAEAHSLLEDLRAPDRLTAQTYQTLYFRILRWRGTCDDPAQAEWRAIHRASCLAFTALLRVWGAEARSRGHQTRADAWARLSGLQALPAL